MHNKPYTNWEIYHERLAFLVIAIVGEVIATSALKSSEGFTKLAPSAVVIIGYGIAFYFLSLVLKSIPVGVAYAVWSGLGVVIITAIAWLLHGQKLDAWGFVGMGLIIAAFLLARSPSWKSLRRPTPW
nr:quaternary ammonium compound efflux SMR transporter QacE delta 1 [Escherichia coli]